MKQKTNDYLKTHDDREVKTTSGSYPMLYGNSLGIELSKAHSNTISCGNVLEKSVKASIENSGLKVYGIKTLLDYNKELDMFDSCRINDDTFNISNRIYLIDKNVFKHIKHNNKGIQPDLLALIFKDGKITFNIIELKMGDNFDTKKSDAEKEHLKAFVEQLNVIKGINPVYKILPFFSNLSKDKLCKSGFKNAFSENEILTRNELSELFGIDFNDLIKQYDNVRDINETQFIDAICVHHNVQKKILKNPNIQNFILDYYMGDILDDTQKKKALENFKIL